MAAMLIPAGSSLRNSKVFSTAVGLMNMASANSAIWSLAYSRLCESAGSLISIAANCSAVPPAIHTGQQPAALVELPELSYLAAVSVFVAWPFMPGNSELLPAILFESTVQPKSGLL